MLGATVKTVGGIEKAFYWGDKWGCEAVQFYLTLSRKWQVDPISQKEIKNFKKAWKNSKVKEVVAHIPYLVNLISENKETKKRSIKRMALEIERANVLGVGYLVLHPGSSGKQNKKKSIEMLKKSFVEVFKLTSPGKVKVLIETMAGQGSALGSSFQEIAQIIHFLDSETFGVCFDSAHVLESGYDIRSSKGYQETFNEFEKYLSIAKIKAFHLNDSKSDFGSRKDRHEHIGNGKIGLTFFKNLLNDKRFENIPKIIETPEVGERSQDNLEILKKLIK